MSDKKQMTSRKAAGIWIALALALCVPLVLAANSPLLAWRQPVYIAAGFAGIIGMCLLLVQPLLANDMLPRLTPRRARSLHRFVGVCLLVAIAVHVIGLWITSPPDVIDALTFTSPTTFSAWGVIAMWAALGAALIMALRRKLKLGPARARALHVSLAIVVVLGSVIHAVLIEGTMETLSKYALCALVLLATGKLVYDRCAPYR